MKKRILSTLLALCMLLSLLPTAALAAGDVAKVEISGATMFYTDFSEAWAAATAGSDATVTLLQTVMPTELLTVPGGTTLTLNLNGKILKRDLSDAAENGHVVTVSTDATLVVQDTSTGATGTIKGGKSTGAGGGIRVERGGTLLLKGGTIGENAAQDGGGVYVADGGAMELLKGAVAKNTATALGGGVYVADGGKFEMRDGFIKENSAESGSGGLHVAASDETEKTILLWGGSIMGNRAAAKAGGVGIAASRVTLTFKIEIYGNTVGSTENAAPCDLFLYSNRLFAIDEELGSLNSIAVVTETAPTEVAPVLLTDASGAQQHGRFYSPDTEHKWVTTAKPEGSADPVMALYRADVIPTFGQDGNAKEIFANGVPLLLVGGWTDGRGVSRYTAIYLDKEPLGELGDDDLLWDPFYKINFECMGSDLRFYTIYGGKETDELVGNTSITMLGGSVKKIYGGGKGAVKGDVNLNVVAYANPESSAPPAAQEVYGGGAEAPVEGDVTITLTQPESPPPAPVSVDKGSAVYGGGSGWDSSARVTGNVSVHMEGGTVARIMGTKDSEIIGNLAVTVDDGLLGEISSCEDAGINAKPDTVLKGNVSIALNGGQTGQIFAGSMDEEITVDGEKTVTVGGSAVVGGTGGGGPTGLLIDGEGTSMGVGSFAVKPDFTGRVEVLLAGLPDFGAAPDFSATPLLATGVTRSNWDKIVATGPASSNIELYRAGSELRMRFSPQAIVTVGGVSTVYPTLREAWEEAVKGNSATVKLRSNVYADELLLEVPQGKHLTLDLNGCQITTFDGRVAAAALLSVAGELTIVDSSPNTEHTILNPLTRQPIAVSGGAVTGNTGRKGGAGIAVEAGGALNMTAGTVAGNNGGIVVAQGGTLNLSGRVVIQDNGYERDSRNLTVGGSVYLAGALDAAADIGVYMDGALPATVAEGNGYTPTAKDAARFSSDKPSFYRILLRGGNVIADKRLPEPAYDEYGESIYANGAPLLLVGGSKSNCTVIYIDNDESGTVTPGDTIWAPEDGDLDDTAAGNDLRVVDLYGGSQWNANVSTHIAIGGGAMIGGRDPLHGIVINGGDENITAGVDSFAIAAPLTGAVYVLLPAGYTSGTIATGAVEGDRDHLHLIGEGAKNKVLTFSQGKVKVDDARRPSVPNVSFTFDAPNAGKLMGATADMEYSLNGGNKWEPCTADMELSVEAISAFYDIKVRVKAAGDIPAGAVQTILIDEGAHLPDTVIATQCTIANNDGTISGLTADMEYKRPGSGGWTTASAGTLTGLTPGDHWVRYKAFGTTQAGFTREFTIQGFYPIYISPAGNDSKDGTTEETAVATWERAKTLVGNGTNRTIVVCDNMTIPDGTELPTGTIIGKIPSVVLTTGKNISLSGELTFDRITLSGDGESSIWASGYNLTVEKGVLVPEGRCAFAAVWGGRQSGSVADYAIITLHSGTYGNVYGGSHGNGNNTYGSSVIIRGTARVTGNVYGGGVEGATAASALVNIYGTATVEGSVYGGGHNANVTDRAAVRVDGNATVTGSVIAGSQGDNATVSEGVLNLADTATIGGDLSAFSDNNKQAHAEIKLVGFTNEPYADDRNIMVSANKLTVQFGSSFHVNTLTTNVKDVVVNEGSTLHLRWDSAISGELSGVGTLVMDKAKLTVASVKANTALTLAIDPGVMGILERDVIVKGGAGKLSAARFTLALPDGYTGGLSIGANGNIKMTAQSPYFTLPAGFKPFAWNTADVVVTAKAGYQLSAGEDGPFGSVLTLADEGDGVAPLIYIKPTAGEVISQPLYYMLDKTPPTVELRSDESDIDAAKWYGASGSIAVTAEDELSGGVTVTVKRDGQAVTYENNVFTANDAGVYTVTVTDEAGNVSTSKVNVDTGIDDFVTLVSGLNSTSTLEQLLAAVGVYSANTHIAASDAGRAAYATLTNYLTDKYGDIVAEINTILAKLSLTRVEITTAQNLYEVLDAPSKALVTPAGRLEALMQAKQEALEFLTEVRNHTAGDWGQLETLVTRYGDLTPSALSLLYEGEREGCDVLKDRYEKVKAFIAAVETITRPHDSTTTPQKVETATALLDAVELCAGEDYVSDAIMAAYDAAWAAVTAAMEVRGQIHALPDHNPGAEGCADMATHRPKVEEAKLAYERLTQEQRVIVPADSVAKLNGQYDALMTHLGYLSKKDDVEVIGLAEKVDTSGLTPGATTVIALSAQKKTPAAEETSAKEALDTAKGQAQSGNLAIGQVGCYDIKLLATVDDNEPVPVQPGAGKKILVRIKLPGSVKGETLSVYHIKDNNSTPVKLDHQLVTENGQTYVVFEVGSFSYFALFAEEKTSSNPDTSGGSAPTWAPVIGAVKGGTVTVTPKNPTTGSKVTVTAKPDESHLPGWVVVTDKNGNKVEVTDNKNGTYTFIQPSGKVNITVIFKPGENALPFADVPFEKFVMFYDAIRFVYENNIMQGTAKDSFSPMMNTDRATIVTILWRLEGKPAATMPAGFSDVTADAWYADSAAWAAESGVVKGYSDGRYAPADPITREQLAAIFYRYAQSKGVDVSGGTDADVQAIMDVELVSPYAMPALRWVCSEGLFVNSPNTRMTPDKPITRVALAATLERFVPKVK